MLNKIINLLKTEGINSKKQVLEILETKDLTILNNLEYDIRNRINFVKLLPYIIEGTKDTKCSLDITTYECVKATKEFTLYNLHQIGLVLDSYEIPFVISGGKVNLKYDYINEDELIIYE